MGDFALDVQLITVNGCFKVCWGHIKRYWTWISGSGFKQTSSSLWTLYAVFQFILLQSLLLSFRPLPQNGNASPILKRISSVLESSSKYDEVQPPPCTFVKRNSTGSVTLNLAPPPPEPVIVHAGAVVSMLHLVPAIHTPQAYQVSIHM